MQIRESRETSWRSRKHWITDITIFVGIETVIEMLSRQENINVPSLGVEKSLRTLSKNLEMKRQNQLSKKNYSSFS